MRYALLLMVFASPAAAHDATPAHPTALDGWVIAATVSVAAAMQVSALKVRK